MIKELMNNAYAWLFLAFCTIAGCLISMYGLTNKRKKEIMYLRNTYSVIQKGENIIPELNIEYKNRKITDFNITKYVIWNGGNEVVERNNMVIEKPLQIVSENKNTVILDAQIIKVSEQTNRISIRSMEDNKIELEFEYIEPENGAVIQVLHTGKADLKVEGKIKGGKAIKNIDRISTKKLSNQKRKRFLSVLMVIMMIDLTFMGIISLLTTWNVISQRELKLSIVESNIVFRMFISIVLVVMMILVIYVTVEIIKREFFFNIPSSLRDAMTHEDYI